MDQLPVYLHPLMSMDPEPHDPINEYEREPVPEKARLGLKSHVGWNIRPLESNASPSKSVLDTSAWTAKDWVAKPSSGIWLGRHGKAHVARNNYVLNTRFGINLCSPDREGMRNRGKIIWQKNGR